MADDSTLVNRLPRLWVGYGIALVFLIAEVVALMLAADLKGAFHAIAISAWLYWLYCVYKFHDVMSGIQGYNHPISPGRAIAMHFIPLYNFYWVFKWPREIARFVNWRMQSARAMNGNVVALLFFLGVLLVRVVDGFLGFLVLFSAVHYISRCIRKSFLASSVSKSSHASAAAGAVGL